tara:strand:+ start:517 stop:909 length:393 start_codon:yes stop_codon:yes gene_type:complete
MKHLSIILLSIFLASCSKSLKVEFVNKSGISLSICSIQDSGSGTQCEQVNNNSQIKLAWRTGDFQITSKGKVFNYKAEVPRPFEKYHESDNPITVIVNSAMSLLVVPIGQAVNTVTINNQPNGWPIEPSA